MSLPLQQSKALFTKAYMKKFKETISVPSFFKSFFKTKTYVTKTIGIEVQRGTEKIAVDVLRGMDGKRNSFSKSTEKEFMPPFYNEYFDATSLDRYDVAFGANPTASPTTIGYLASDVAEKYVQLMNKIERSKELQCSQVLETGVVELVNGTNIDYKRKAGSMVDLVGAGGYWTTTTTNIEAQLIAGGDFLRKTGKNASKEVNLALSGEAWVNLKKSDYFKNTANFNQVSLFDVKMPQADASGAAFVGRITAGAYIVNVWVYDEGYINQSGTWTRYMDVTKAVMTPVRGTIFELAHAGVPAIIADKKNAEFSEYIAQLKAEYYLNNYIDPKRKAHIFEILSAPLAVPVTVDMIYTMKTKA